MFVIYDADRRYRELCLELANNKRRVVDSGQSIIESREAALDPEQKAKAETTTP